MALCKGLLVAAIISLAAADLSDFLNGAQWAKSNQYRFHVAIEPISPQDSHHAFLCSGAIVAPGWVLTSGACASQSKTFEIRYDSVNYFTSGGSVVSNETYVHPSYNSASQFGNVGLIHAPGLGGEAIDLLPANSNVSERFSIVTGWGRLHKNPSPILRYVYGTILDVHKTSVCRRNFGHMVENETELLCARALKQSGCAGDSGSPLIIQTHNSSYLVGVAIFNADYDECYASTSLFASLKDGVRDWIAELTGIKS